MHVLLGIDGSPHAMRATRFLSAFPSEKLSVEIVAVLSYTLYPYALVSGEQAVSQEENLEEVERAVHATTAEAVAMLRARGVTVTVTTRFGNPADEILSVAADHEVDMIVMGRRGVRGLDRVMGSVSERVLKHAHVPVLLVP